MRQPTRKPIILLYFLTVLSVTTGFLIGYKLPLYSEAVNTEYPESKLSVILETIAENYVDSVNIQELNEWSIYYFVAQLDPHSYYFSANETEYYDYSEEPIERGGVNIYLAKKR